MLDLLGLFSGVKGQRSLGAVSENEPILVHFIFIIQIKLIFWMTLSSYDVERRQT